MKSYISRYISILGEDKSKIPFIVILFIGTALLDLLGIGLIPYLIKEASNNYGSNIDNKKIELSYNLILISTLIITLFIFKSVLSYLSNKKIILFGLNHQSYIIKKIFSCYQNGDYNLIRKIPLSQTLNTIDNSIRIYIEQTLIASLKLASDFIIFIFILVLLLYQNFIFTILLAGIFSVIVLAFDAIFKEKFVQASQNIQKASTQIIKEVHQSIEGFKEIRILGIEKHIHNKLAKRADEYAINSVLAQSARNMPRYLLESALIIFSLSISVSMMYQGFQMEEIVAMNAIFFLAGLKITPSLYQISNSISSMRFSRSHMNDIYITINELNQGKDNIDITKAGLCGAFENLKIENVSFYYSEKKDNISNVSISIDRCECIQIKGVSGSGKTTLIDVIVGLLNPKTGRVLVNDQDIKNIKDSWRKKIAYIPQTVLIYESNFIENITMIGENEIIDYEKLVDSAKKAQIFDLISNSDLGFNTALGANGISLSGGERKKLALARAIYNDREIIIMDELTAGLDINSRDEVYNTLNKMLSNKTIIFTSHEEIVNLKIDKTIYL